MCEKVPTLRVHSPVRAHDEWDSRETSTQPPIRRLFRLLRRLIGG